MSRIMSARNRALIPLVVLQSMVLACNPSPGESRSVIIIAHRGASGYLPEHTLESYRLAIELGADFVEPDLVMSRDGVLVARHENEIGGTTDVAEKFPDRKTTKTIDGAPVTGWFTEDFTFSELRTLRARERLATRSHQNDDRFLIPSFEEVLDLLKQHEAATGRRIGVYPETKHPSYFRSIELPLEEKLVALLHRYAYREPSDPAFIQSFETSNLKMLRELTNVRLIQLLEVDGAPWDHRTDGIVGGYAAMITPRGLREIARYAFGIGPNKRLIIPESSTIDSDGGTTSLVSNAHATGLAVHPWTFRSDPPFLDLRYQGDAATELTAFLRLGIDGLFTDFPDHAASTIEALRPKPGHVDRP